MKKIKELIEKKIWLDNAYILVALKDLKIKQIQKKAVCVILEDGISEELNLT